MKCGHSRNLFYVSRSCFSFYLHTFVTHLNKWNTRWDFIFFDIWKLLVAYKHTYFVQRNRMKCGHSRNAVYRRDFTADREPWTCAATISQVRELSHRPLYWALSHHRMCRYGSRVISLRDLVVYVIFIVYMLWITLVAYKHTYFAQRNRMKCGHSRNLFYVSRSCFSFHVHTFVAHLNKWNTRWDFIFIRHLKTTCGI